MPSAVRRFLALPWPDQAATVEALIAVTGARIRLSLFSDSTVSQWLQPKMRAPSLESKSEWLEPGGAVERVRFAVQRASLRVPGASCLVQAIAGSQMLQSRGIASRIRIGIGKKHSTLLSAHAWLTVGDTIVLGGADASHEFEELI